MLNALNHVDQLIHDLKQVSLFDKYKKVAVFYRANYPVLANPIFPEPLEFFAERVSKPQFSSPSSSSTSSIVHRLPGLFKRSTAK